MIGFARGRAGPWRSPKHGSKSKRGEITARKTRGPRSSARWPTCQASGWSGWRSPPIAGCRSRWICWWIPPPSIRIRTGPEHRPLTTTKQRGRPGRFHDVCSDPIVAFANCYRYSWGGDTVKGAFAWSIMASLDRIALPLLNILYFGSMAAL